MLTCRTGTLLRLVAGSYWAFNLEAVGIDSWIVTWPNAIPADEPFNASTDWFETPDDALLAALEHHWAKQ